MYHRWKAQKVIKKEVWARIPPQQSQRLIKGDGVSHLREAQSTADTRLHQNEPLEESDRDASWVRSSGYVLLGQGFSLQIIFLGLSFEASSHKYQKSIIEKPPIWENPLKKSQVSSPNRYY